MRRLLWFKTADHRLWLESLENRVPMRQRAREMINIELELIKRVEMNDPDAVAWAWATRQEELISAS